MIKRRFGRTNFDITALSVGCYQLTSWFGNTLEETQEALDYAFNAGINYYDCAPLYGWGESEEHVGRAQARHKDKEVFIGDKVGRYIVWEGDWPRIPRLRKNPDIRYTERDTLLRNIKSSLWTLQRDHFDLLMIHEPNYSQWEFDYETGDSVVLNLLEELKKEGLVANIGIAGWDYKLQAKLVDTGRIDACMVAGGIGLVEDTMYDELVPACRRNDAGIVVGSVFGQGNPFLLGKHRGAVQELLLNADDEEKIISGKQLLKLYDLADECNSSMVEFTLRYVLALEDIHSNACGIRNVEQLKEDIEIIERGPLDQKFVDEVAMIRKQSKGGLTNHKMALFANDVEEYIRANPEG